MKKSFLFLALLLAPLVPLSAMKITDIEQAITCAFLKKTVAIGGKNGCGLFDTVSGNHIKKLTGEKTYRIAATRNKKTIAVLDDKGLSCFTVKTGNMEFFAHHYSLAALTFNANDTLFTYKTGQLKTYNCTTKTCVAVDTLAWEPGTTPITTISCHPTKDEIIYPSKTNQLSIAQPGRSPLIKTHLQPTNLYYLQAGEYSPDGKYIAINEHTDKVFIYDLDQNVCFQLCADNQEYIAMAFHPHNSMIALLTRSSCVYYFNYKTGMLIAATHPLNIPDPDRYKPFHNRLAFSDTEAQLLAAPLGAGCFILNVPQSNLTSVYYALYYGGLPKDLVWLILGGIIMQQNTVRPHGFSYYDFDELKHVEQVTLPAEPSEEEESPMELEETEIIKITAV